MYEYRCTLNRVIDGDTVDLTIDLGFYIFRRERIRLLGINTPELTGPTAAQGARAAAVLFDMLKGQPLTIQTKKDKTDKYGRMLGTLWAGSRNCNQALVEGGYAVPYMVE
jgi:micrococcal nuclease